MWTTGPTEGNQSKSCGAVLLKCCILKMKSWGFREDTASMEHSKGSKRHSDTELLDIEWLERAGRGKSKRQRDWRERARAL